VIKLVEILKEIEDEKGRAYSWQKPDGTFIPIDYNHGSDAFKHLGGPRHVDGNADHTLMLWRQGWQRITYMVFGDLSTLFAHNEFQPPNEKQKAKLIELALELGLNKVEWDGGEKDRILWTINDTL
jgi:hypothetical protein